MNILISGAHGLIGTELTKQLRDRGDRVVHLIRSSQAGRDQVSWNPYQLRIVLPEVEAFDAWIHLSGASIGEKRLTEKQKQRVWDSRVATTEFIANKMGELNAPPKTFICASAVGYYGSRGSDFLTEDEPNGTGFLASLCKYWEETAQETAQYGCRVVNLRSGVVLDKDGGALEKQLPIFKMAIGGRLGNGMQWTSWITLHDEVRAIIHALDTPSLTGPINVCSPNPVTNAEYTIRLGLALNRPAIVPTPRPILSLVMGSTLTDEVLMASQRALPEKLAASGFEFDYPLLEDGLRRAIYGEPEPEESEEETEETETDEK